MVLPQCETRNAGNLDAILMKGVDGIFIGPMTLFQSYDKPGKMSDPEIQRIIDMVLEKCKKHNKYC